MKATSSALDITHFNPLAIATDKTEGYQPADLKDLVDRAVQQAVMRSCRKHVSGGSIAVCFQSPELCP